MASEFLQRFHFDESEGEEGLIIVESMQDVEPILRANQAKRNACDGYSPSRELRHAISIPFILAHEWWQQGLNVFDDDDWERIEALLMDPDYSKLRCADGEIRKRPTRYYCRASTASAKALAGFRAEVVE